MNPPIEVLYAPIACSDDAPFRLPVVRYADHCAEMERNTARVESLLREIEQLTALSERLQAELTVARYTRDETNKLIARWDAHLRFMRRVKRTPGTCPPDALDKLPAGRWDGKPKAL